ncbi:hypothetical protein [Arthrobacter sp. MMS18-M83]|uniref:hypothetical protein n=1 Tax=Arthrobacter sp. MMS18-M83 TaxID=2996261 RepID=UPI00227B58CE|nr:hypothetical protein [Arthrobacter sp. MMS18-M83]WAH98143.1 hypothetical protein OW521_04475 [Arthrobacter sp. MMS18-M83]
MDLLAANLIASLLTLIAFTLVALWYLAPALKRKPLAGALTILLWFHAFRYVALQIFSAGAVGGLNASSGTLQTIAFGDLVTAVLALISIAALRRELGGAARVLVWATAIIGTADLVSATMVGISGHLIDTASNWSWIILAVYVPVLWITAVMLFWQLLTRRNELLSSADAASSKTS